MLTRAVMSTCVRVSKKVHAKIDAETDKQNSRHIPHPFLHKVEFARERSDRHRTI